ncbi:MAG: hypothetical protein J7L96_03990, partial [Bacteroidales bacterium]|nr:hypothetical protein [Bacteroidales bacterium]
AKPGKSEPYPAVYNDFNPELKVVEKADGWYLDITFDKDWISAQSRKLITTEMLGFAEVPNLPFVHPDDKPYKIDIDYFGKKRNKDNLSPGPFVITNDGKQLIKVWPKSEY